MLSGKHGGDMINTTVLGSHTSSQRDSWWYLIQRADGSLWVKYENDDDHSDDWEKPLHEVLTSNVGVSAKELVQSRIDRMFEDRKA
jgi:hypothetical protein